MDKNDFVAPSLRELPRLPFEPTADEWRATYEMLCGHCSRQLRCEIVDAMIEMKDGGEWPAGGWVTDPGAGVSCLPVWSITPEGRAALSADGGER